jgi:hypothetical protein
MNDPLYAGRLIRTQSGIYVDVFDPKPEMFVVEDIAHALSMQCRFSGHLRRFFSVAQHSVMVSFRVGDGKRLAALLHDASEAYLVDLPKPIKEELAEYKVVEDRVMAALAEKFGFPYPLDPEIKDIDKLMLEWEWHQLMLGQPPTLAMSEINPWTPEKAKDVFLAMYRSYTNQPSYIF